MNETGQASHSYKHAKAPPPAFNPGLKPVSPVLEPPGGGRFGGAGAAREGERGEEKAKEVLPNFKNFGEFKKDVLRKHIKWALDSNAQAEGRSTFYLGWPGL